MLAVRGGLRVSLGQYSEAIRDFRKVLRVRPDWVHIRNALGIAEFKNGNVTASERSFRECMRTAPLYEEAFQNLLRIEMMARRFEDVLREVESRYSPADAPPSIGRITGQAALAMSRWRDALKWLECSLEKTSVPFTRARLFVDIGYTYAQLGNHARAGGFFERSVEADPSELAILNRARAYMYEGKPQLAADWLSRAPHSGRRPAYDRLKLMFRALWLAGKTADLGKLGEELIAHPEADAAGFTMYTSVLVDNLSRSQDAVRIAREGHKRFSNDAILSNNLAYSLLMDGQVAEAQAVLDAAREPEELGDVAVLTATRGLLLLKQGDIGGGRDLYEKALAIAPTEQLRERIRSKRDLELGRALRAIGRTGEAEALFARSAETSRAASPYNEQAVSEMRLLSSGS
jgi:tetratricopeptide (TPR) repeat protein